MFLSLSWLVAVVCMTPMDDKDSSRQALARLEGVWSFTLVEVEGKKQTPAPFATNKMIIAADGQYVVIQPNQVTRGVIKPGPEETPRHLDATVMSGSMKGTTLLGRYEISPDGLKICYAFPGKPRPTRLISEAGSGTILFGFQREKQTVQEAFLEAGRKELTGTWQSVTYALDGKEATSEELKKVQLKIDAQGLATAYQDGKVFIASATQIDPMADPMTIDIAFTEGAGKGKTALGIYKIESNVLTICRAEPGKPRPKEFSSRPGSGLTLMTYEREKSTK